MGRRDRDERPEIEIFRPVGAAAETVVVQSGGGGPPRRTVLAIVGVLLALVVAGLLFADGADDESAVDSTTTTTRPTTTTTRRSTTTSTASTTTTVVSGPVLESATGALLVAVASGDWVVVDLDTGTRRDVDLGSPDGGYSGIGVRDGVVLVSGDRTATYWDVRQDPPVAAALGVADRAFPTSSPDEVWLVDNNGYAMSNAGDVVNTARLVGLDGSVLRTFGLGPDVYALGVTDDGVVTQGGGRLFLADEHGSHPLAVGEGMATTVDAVLARTCDAGARCGMALIDVSTGQSRPLPAEVDSSDGLQIVSARADEITFVVYGNQGSQQLWVVDGKGRLLAHDDVSTINNIPAPLPGGRGWLLSTAGGHLQRLVRVGSRLTEAPLAGLDDLAGEIVLITRP